MTRRFTTIIFFIISVFSSFLTNAQTISGRLISEETKNPLPAIFLTLSGANDVSVYTNGLGRFTFDNVPSGDYKITALFRGEIILIKEVSLAKEDVQLGDVTTIIVPTTNTESISMIDASDLTGLESENDNFSGLLNAGRDALSNAAAFNLSTARFRMRGYFNEDSDVLINGMPMNDLDDGRVLWTAWSGLNDVFRGQTQVINMQENDFTFGGIGGATYIDLRASDQRPQKKAVYSFSNRTYQHRIMYTHSTGMQKNGWAYSFSGSYRYGAQGYIAGTYMQGLSYFGSVDKKIGKNHLLNAVFFATPQRRGRSTGTFQEVYDLTDNNFHNPNWGYQNGEVRNSREYRINQPVAMLRHDWNVSRKLNISTTAGYQFGTFGSTRLDWYEASDPRPDYYRKLPSYALNEDAKLEITNAFKNDVNVNQVNWDALYDANSTRFYTIENANGIPGNNVSGKLAAYIVEEEHFDNEKLAFNTVFKYLPNFKTSITGGLQWLNDITHNYRKVDDLLGADFYIDFDRFALQAFPNTPDIQQNDINNPNRILKVGDKYGFDYDINLNKVSTWVQAAVTGQKIDYFVALQLSNTSFFREGFTQNGKFPDNSLGKSTVESFLNHGSKLGVTYKIDGRNYLVFNAGYRTRAPFARESFLSPRVRDNVITGLKSERITSADLSYIMRYSSLNGRVSAFYTTFKDQISNNVFYHDEFRSFVNYAMNGIDKRHLGVELGLTYKINPTWSTSLAGTIGEYIYTSRPLATVNRDNSVEELVTNREVFIKNYYVGGMPQKAGSVGVDYNHNFWWLTLRVNGFTDTYLEVNPDRRTAIATDLLDPIETPELLQQVIGQEKVSGGYTVDFSASKSWRLKNGRFIGFNFNVGNLLNNTNLVTGGFEQFRFDYETKDVNRFPPRYFYAFGTNYSLNINYRF